jgi:hypothetical protein
MTRLLVLMVRAVVFVRTFGFEYFHGDRTAVDGLVPAQHATRR